MSSDQIERALRNGAPATGGKRPAELDARLIAAADERDLIDIAYAIEDSPIGKLLLAATGHGLVRVSYIDDGETEVLDGLAESISPRIFEQPARVDVARRQLEQFFDRKRQRFELELDWTLTSGFRRTVLRRLAETEYGSVCSYGELAAASGSSRAARAVGSAMASNPLPIIVPCHRVLRGGGEIGNYGGGVHRKRALLELEGALSPGSDRVKLNR